MVHFGEYLNDYLEYNNMSQSEFALRLGVTQKHINEIIAGKQNITIEMATCIERLTSIPASFILGVESDRIITENLIKEYGNEKNLLNILRNDYALNDLKKAKWINFKDETNIYQLSIDILNFLKIRDFKVNEKLKDYVLFKKSGEDYNRLALWIAKCDEIASKQEINTYEKEKFNDLILELKLESYNEFNIDNIAKILNKYGIFFVCQKALPSTKVRGCFKVKGKTPAIYVTKNYSSKDSFFFELFHELGHCKSDYNIAKSKTIVDGDESREARADKFALNAMISEEILEEIIISKTEDEYIKISDKYKIPMSFIVGRLAKLGNISYSSKIYNKYKNV